MVGGFPWSVDAEDRGRGRCQSVEVGVRVKCWIDTADSWSCAGPNQSSAVQCKPLGTSLPRRQSQRDEKIWTSVDCCPTDKVRLCWHCRQVGFRTERQKKELESDVE